jgi:FKBP-type peptidyl-prolyl cis-trans isomerase FkpA
MRYLLSSFIVLACLGLSACLKTEEVPTFEEQLTKDIEAIDAYLAARSITAIQHESGLRYVVTEAGTGPKPTLANSVRVTYKGTFLSNGQVFDQSDAPIELELTRVIIGWQIALPLLEEGTKTTLYIPSGLAYGFDGVRDRNGSVVIPQNANLIFEIELLEVI